MVSIALVYISIIFTLYFNNPIMASGGEEEGKKELEKKVLDKKELEKKETDISKYIDKVNKHPGYMVLTVEEYNKLLQVSSTPKKVEPPKPKLALGSPIKNIGPRVQTLLNTLSGTTPKVEHSRPILSTPSPNLNTSTSTCVNPINPPKLPLFSGTDEPQKGEVPYEVWSFELKCLKKSGQYPEYTLLQAVRNSLKGLARSMLVPLGEDVCLTDIINKLDGFFGSVSTNENLMQAFYSDYQKESESIVVYASRLEETISKAIQFGFIDQVAKDAMLRNKFWTGLYSQTLKNSTRHLYDSIKDFQILLKEIRKVQQEDQGQQKTKVRAAAANADTAENEDWKKELKELVSKIDRLEQNINSQQYNYQELTRKLNNFELQESKENTVPSNVERGLHRPFRGRYRGFRRSQGRGFQENNYRGQGNFRGQCNSGSGQMTQYDQSQRSQKFQPKE